jgi:hypothetical protein
MRVNLVAAPLRVPVLLDPRCAGSSAAWPFAGAHRRLCLHASSHSSSALFLRKVPFKKKKGAVEYSFCTLWLLHITFDHLSYSKNLWKCSNNYNILKIYIMIKYLIVK